MNSRIANDQCIDEPNPGTPDANVCHQRLEGRIAARRGVCESCCPYPHASPFGNSRTQWFLGYLDARLSRFYVRRPHLLIEEGE